MTRATRRHPRRTLALLTALALIAACGGDATTTTSTTPGDLTTTTAATTTTTEPRDPFDEDALILSTVRVYLAQDTGQNVSRYPDYAGTGVVIDPSGLILTNAHVAVPKERGIRVLDREWPEMPAEANALLVATTNNPRIAAGTFYVAEVLVADLWLDLAVIRIVSDSTHNPVELDLTPVTLGDSSVLQVGDFVRAMGYPVDQPQMSITTGEITGFESDERTGIERFWITNSATIFPGSSGGILHDEWGDLVGITSRETTGVFYAKPIDLAKPLIADALAGERYVRTTGIEFGTGAEAFTFIGVSSTVDANGCPVDPVGVLPGGAASAFVVYSFSGMTDGLDVEAVWALDGDPLREKRHLWSHGASGGCVAFELEAPPDGSHVLNLFGGPDMRHFAINGFGVGVEPNSVQVGIVVLDAQTRRPISGATVHLLTPSTNPQQWLANQTDAARVTGGTTGPNGAVILPDRLIRGQRYAVVVIAQGYRETAFCCYQMPTDASDPHSAVVNLQR